MPGASNLSPVMPFRNRLLRMPSWICSQQQQKAMNAQQAASVCREAGFYSLNPAGMQLWRPSAGGAAASPSHSLCYLLLAACYAPHPHLVNQAKEILQYSAN
jgi:hypothetical protein